MTITTNHILFIFGLAVFTFSVFIINVLNVLKVISQNLVALYTRHAGIVESLNENTKLQTEFNRSILSLLSQKEVPLEAFKNDDVILSKPPN